MALTHLQLEHIMQVLKELDIEKINLDNVEIRREWKSIYLLIILDDLVVCIEKTSGGDDEPVDMDYFARLAEDTI